MLIQLLQGIDVFAERCHCHYIVSFNQINGTSWLTSTLSSHSTRLYITEHAIVCLKEPITFVLSFSWGVLWRNNVIIFMV